MRNGSRKQILLGQPAAISGTSNPRESSSLHNPERASGSQCRFSGKPRCHADDAIPFGRRFKEDHSTSSTLPPAKPPEPAASKPEPPPEPPSPPSIAELTARAEDFILDLIGKTSAFARPARNQHSEPICVAQFRTVQCPQNENA